MAAHQTPPSLGFSRQEHWSGLPFPSPMHASEKGKWSRSVLSDSLRPHGPQPTRLLHPWDFPGKSTGIGCHCLLQIWCLVFPIINLVFVLNHIWPLGERGLSIYTLISCGFWIEGVVSRAENWREKEGDSPIKLSNVTSMNAILFFFEKKSGFIWWNNIIV